MKGLIWGIFGIGLFLTGCEEKETACNTGDMQCDGDLLQECDANGAWTNVEDCSESEKMCHAEMSHCM